MLRRRLAALTGFLVQAAGHGAHRLLLRNLSLNQLGLRLVAATGANIVRRSRIGEVDPRAPRRRRHRRNFLLPAESRLFCYEFRR